MNNSDILFRKRVKEEIVGVLSNRWMTFLQILKRSLNCDPEVLFNEIEELKSLGVVCAREDVDGIKYRLSAGCKIGKEDEEKEKKSERVKWELKDSKILGLEKKVDSILASLPEASPVYSQWWFCRSVYERLVKFLLSIEVKNARMAFIGCSTLGSITSNYNKEKVDIFDIDKVLLDAVKEHCVEGTRLIHYDVTSGRRQDMEGRFNVVVADPPWSRTLLKSFLVRSASFVCRGGALVISFPQILTRHSAEIERKNLVELAEKLGLLLQNVLVGFSKYGVPEFEKNAYESYGLKLDEAWRKGDLFIFRKEKRPSINSEQLITSMPKWEQFTQGKKRIFLKRDGYFEAGQMNVKTIDGLEDLVYQSTSSRKDAWRCASLISTRNCVAHAYGRKELSMTLKEMLTEKCNYIKGDRKIGVQATDRVKRRILDMM